jgi:hypothetical protein
METLQQNVRKTAVEANKDLLSVASQLGLPNCHAPGGVGQDTGFDNVTRAVRVAGCAELARNCDEELLPALRAVWLGITEVSLEQLDRAEELHISHPSWWDADRRAAALLGERMQIDIDALNKRPYDHMLNALAYRDNREAFPELRRFALTEEQLLELLGPIGHTINADDRWTALRLRSGMSQAELDERYETERGKHLDNMVSTCRDMLEIHSQRVSDDLQKWKDRVRAPGAVRTGFASQFNDHPYQSRVTQDMEMLSDEAAIARWLEGSEQ